MPCDVDGDELPANTPPPPQPKCSTDDWYPYADCNEFEAADLLFTCE